MGELPSSKIQGNTGSKTSHHKIYFVGPIIKLFNLYINIYIYTQTQCSHFPVDVTGSIFFKKCSFSTNCIKFLKCLTYYVSWSLNLCTQTHLHTYKYTWLFAYINKYVNPTLKIVIVSKPTFSSMKSNCNETERHPYSKGYSITAFASVKQPRMYYRISWSNQNFNIICFLIYSMYTSHFIQVLILNFI